MSTISIFHASGKVNFCNNMVLNAATIVEVLEGAWRRSAKTNNVRKMVNYIRRLFGVGSV